MKAEHIKILIWAVVISFIMVVVLQVYFKNREMKVNNNAGTIETEADIISEEIEENDAAMETEDKIAEKSGDSSKDYRIVIDDFPKMQIEKIVTETVDDGKENQEMHYETYYISDVDFVELKDNTSDYTLAVKEDAFDSDRIAQVNFADAFGFSYISCEDMYEVVETARKSMGFDRDYSDALCDNEKKSRLGEESYIYEKDCSIIGQMLEKVDYDALLQAKCSYSVADEAEIKYPVSFTAVVQYEKDDVIYTKTAYLGFSGEKTSNQTDVRQVSCEKDSVCGACGETQGCNENCGGSCCE